MKFGYELTVILVMLAFNAIFAAYEMALASISRARIQVLLGEGKGGAMEAAFMKDRMEASLAVVQLGITLAGAFAAATGGAGIGEHLSPVLQRGLGLPKGFSEALSIIILVLPLSFFTIVFAELVPKILAIGNREWVVLKLSPPMKLLSEMMYPIVHVFEMSVKGVSAVFAKMIPPSSQTQQQSLHELKAAASLARAAHLLGSREEKIVFAAASLTIRPVGEIVIPAEDISAIPIESMIAEAFIKAHLDMHTRFPVCAVDGDTQTIQGYVNFKDILVAMKMNPQDKGIKGIVRPIKKVDKMMPVSQLLEQLIQEKTHIALVMSGPDVMGMVTMEDIIEELVGEIEDEFDKLPTHIHPYGSSWLVGGGVPMSMVAASVGADWENTSGTKKVPTLSEWCIENMEAPLMGGEVIEIGNFQIIPRKLRRKKLAEAVVSHRRHDVDDI
jgi:putative hemolysin